MCMPPCIGHAMSPGLNTLLSADTKHMGHMVDSVYFIACRTQTDKVYIIKLLAAEQSSQL